MFRGHFAEEDNDDDDFLLTPRSRDRFGQGLSQHPSDRFERLTRRPSHLEQRSHNNYYSQQVPQRDGYRPSTSHETYHFQRSHERHYPPGRPYRDSHSPQRLFITHFSYDFPGLRHQHSSQQPSYDNYHSLPRRQHGSHFSEQPLVSGCSPQYRSRETTWRSSYSEERKKRSHVRENNFVSRGPSASTKEPWLKTSPEKNNSRSLNLPSDSDNLKEDQHPDSRPTLANRNIKSGGYKNTVRSHSDNSNLNEQNIERETARTESVKSETAELKKIHLNEPSDIKENKFKVRQEKDGEIRRTDKCSSTINSQSTKEKYMREESDYLVKWHSSRIDHDKTAESAEEIKTQKIDSDKSGPGKGGDSGTSVDFDTVYDRDNRDKVEKTGAEKLKNERGNSFDLTGRNDSKSSVSADKAKEKSTKHISGKHKLNTQKSFHDKPVSKWSLEKKFEMLKKHKNSSSVRDVKTKNERNKSLKYSLAGSKKSGQKYFADSYGGMKIESNVNCNSVLVPDERTTEQTKTSRISLTSEVSFKAEASKPFFEKEISNSSDTNIESGKTDSSGKGYLSSSRSERNSGSEMSTFDFAGNIFRPNITKSQQIKNSDKISNENTKDLGGKQITEEKVEKVFDFHKEKDIQINREETLSKNKNTHKNLSILGSDSSGSDELDHFKNLLTQVDDSRWKKKPVSIGSRRSSTQSVKSTDSDASTSLLNPKLERKVLSENAFRKYGLSNIEYRNKKIYFKKIRIRQPLIMLRKKDIKNVLRHKKMLTLKRKLNQTKKVQFKRIRTISSSSYESEIRKRAKICGLANENVISVTSVVDEKAYNRHKFDSIVPETPGESDSSTRSSYVSKSSTHKTKRTRHKTERSRVYKSQGNSTKSNQDKSKKGLEKKNPKNNLSNISEKPGLSSSDEKPDVLKNIGQSALDSNLKTPSDIKAKTDVKLSNQSYLDSDVLDSKVASLHREANDKRRENISNKKTNRSSCSPVFRHKGVKPKAKSKSGIIETESTESDSETETESLKKDIKRSAIILETEGESSSPDVLEKKCSSKSDKQHLSAIVKPCEIVLTKISELQDEENFSRREKLNSEHTVEEHIGNLTEIPETQVSSTSFALSVDSTFSKTLSTDAAGKNERLTATANSFQTKIPVSNEVEGYLGSKADTIEKGMNIENKIPNVSSEETQTYSCGNTVYDEGIDTRKENDFVFAQQPFKKDVPGKIAEHYVGDISTDECQRNSKIQTAVVAPIQQYDQENASLTLKQNFSSENKMKQSFKSFQARVMKYQQKQRKLRSTNITKKLQAKGLLPERDETGEEGDIEDNLLIVSLSETEDSDFDIQSENIDKDVEKDKNASQIFTLQENVKSIFDEGENGYSLKSENMKSERSVMNKVGDHIDTQSIMRLENESEVISFNKEAIGIDIPNVIIKNEPFDEKDDDVNYESFTSSSSQNSYNSDTEVKKETENEAVSALWDKVECRHLPFHGNELNSLELNETTDKANKDSNIPPVLPYNQKKVEYKDLVVDTDPQTSISAEKNKQIQIKEEPDWSKFSYSQEPDAIFISDSEDNASDIMPPQNKTVFLNIDSDSDNMLLSSQKQHASQQDTEVLDPEFWDFSSSENFSSSDEEDKPGDFLKYDQTSLTGTRKQTVKQDKVVTDDEGLVFVGSRLESDAKHTEKEGVGDRYSGSDSSANESEYVELTSSDKDTEGDITLKSVATVTNNLSSPGFTPKRPNDASSTEASIPATVPDLFDPYSVETQVNTSLSSSNRVHALEEVNSHRLKPYLKYLHDSNSEAESWKSEIELTRDIKRSSCFNESSYDKIFQRNTQVDTYANKNDFVTNRTELDNIYHQATQIISEAEGLDTGISKYSKSSVDPDNSDSLSDSSLVDSADKQISLYQQARSCPEKRKISVVGLQIRYEDKAFGLGRSLFPNKTDSEEPVSNEIMAFTSNIDRTVVSENDWYSKMTQLDPSDVGNMSSSSSYKSEKLSELGYAAQTQNDTLVSNDSRYEISSDDNGSLLSVGGDRIVSDDSKNSNKDIYFESTQYDAGIKSMHNNSTQADDSKKTSEYLTEVYADQIDNKDEFTPYKALTQVDENLLHKQSDESEMDVEEIDAYAYMTQIDPKSSTSRDQESKSYKESSPDKSHYSELRQTDVCILSSDSDNDKYFTLTQVDKRCKKEPVEVSDIIQNVYEMETQIEGEINVHKASDNDSVNLITDSDNMGHDSEKDNIPKNFFENTQNESSISNSKKLSVQNSLIRPRSLSGDRDEERASKLNSLKGKLKLTFVERKTIEIPMQKVKSYREKKIVRQSSAPGVSENSSKISDSRNNAIELLPKTTDITAKQSGSVSTPLDNLAFHNAKISDMWLSKITKSKKMPPKLPGKRKRRTTGETKATASFKKTIKEARKQLADRNYQTIFHPETRAYPQKKQKWDINVPAANNLEDVDLPSCSQIVSKGLPILNPTDMLVKKNKSQQKSSSRFSSRAASLTETMVESNSLSGKDSSKPVLSGETDIPDKLNPTSVTKTSEKTEQQIEVTGATDSAFDNLEKQVDRHKLDSERTETEKEKLAYGDVREYGKLHKRKLSRLSKSSDYMPDTKTSKTELDADRDKTVSDSDENFNNPSKEKSVDKVPTIVRDKNPDTAGSTSPDFQSHNTAKSSERNVQSDTGSSGRVSVVEQSKAEDIVKRAAQPGDEKEITDKQMVVSASNKSRITAENPESTKSKPAWDLSLVGSYKRSHEARTGKSTKRVTFNDSVTQSSKDNIRAASGSNTGQNPTKCDPKNATQKVNLMLKTLPQSSVTHSACTTRIQRNIPGQPFQPRKNQIPAVASTHYSPADYEKGITYKEFMAAMLRWIPVWFEEHAKFLEKDHSAMPPNCTNGLPGSTELYPLTEKYTSFKEYSDIFMSPLLLFETWEKCFQEFREKQSRKNDLKHRLCPSAMYDAGDKLNEFVLLGLLPESQKNQFFYKGDLVILAVYGVQLDEKNIKGAPKRIEMIAFLEEVIYKTVDVNKLCTHNMEIAKMRKPDSFSVKVILRTRKRRFNLDYTVLAEVTQVASVVTTLRQFKAMECFPKNPLCRDILNPMNNETYCDKPPLNNNTLKIEGDFNESQRRAIMTASLMVSRPYHMPRICLLQGPPGTGKSHTILGIINQILKDKQDKKQQARICLCAQSHAAVDELLRRLDRQNRRAKEKGAGTVKLIRIGKPSSAHEDVRNLCLDKLIEKNVKLEIAVEKEKQLPRSLQAEKVTLEKKIQALKAGIKNSTYLKKKKLTIDLKDLEKQHDNLMGKCKVDVSNVKPTPEHEWKVKNNLIQNAHVIAGTLSGIGSSILRQYFESKGKENRPFDCIIIDEATQAIELDTLIPLQYGTTKLILVGDPEQLPPTVKSQVATENRFNLSLFERLNSHFRFSNYNPVIMLDTQYRMDPEICSFPSNYVYDGKLKTDKSIYARRQCGLVPYLLYDVADGREQLSQCSGSVSNPVEALFTVRLVKFIVENTNVTANVIGIIAPYQKQKSLLITHLQDSSIKGSHAIEVSTVDGFQGREKHVIIMSCVRAKSSTGTIGFVGKRNRMNVSLTRAKYALYVIAHFESLEKSDEWKALIEDADSRKKRIPVNELNVDEALAKCLKRNQRPP